MVEFHDDFGCWIEVKVSFGVFVWWFNARWGRPRLGLVLKLKVFLMAGLSMRIQREDPRKLCLYVSVAKDCE